MIFIFYIVLYLAASVGTFSMAFLTYRSSRTLQNKYFALFASFISAWLILQFLAQLTHEHHEVAIALLRAAVTFTPLIGYAFLLFARQYVGRIKKNSPWLLLVPAIILTGSWTPYLIKTATITRSGIAIKSAGFLYDAVFIYAVAVFGIGIFAIYNNYRAYHKDRQKSARTRLLMGALLQLLLVTVGGSVFLANNAVSQLLVPISSFIMAAIVAYAIVKHSLFDVRLVVARSLVYLASLFTLGLVFTVVTFSLTNIFFANNNAVNTPVRWVYTGLALVLVFIFPPLKRFFDRITNRFLFQDAYDPQLFLDAFNKALIDNIQLGILLRHTATIIEEHLKCEHVIFVVFDADNAQARLINSKGVSALYRDPHKLRKVFDRFTGKLEIAEEPNSNWGDLQEVLHLTDLAAVAHLQSAVKKGEQTKAYLVLGAKKSGNIYSSQDVRMIEIIANELVIAIQNALRFEEIENFNITLQQKVDDATKKLRHVNERLRSLDETKDDFISMASHQLRTPLTSVKGYLSMVLEGDAGKVTPQEQEMLQQAFFSAQRMVYLIADLLNVSRLKTGKFVIEPIKVNLATVVGQEIEQLKETAKSRHLTLIYEQPKDFPEALLDETKTRQVIMNFVDNAIYYTPAGGQITVKLIDSAATIELRVEDNGIGVPKSEQHHLFTKFYRAGNARKARPDGTGLGLFMAKKVIVAQGGSVIFESEEGKGSTFGFIFSKSHLNSLPVAAPIPASPAKEPTADV
jgi:signal transduction histidine kinase